MTRPHVRESLTFACLPSLLEQIVVLPAHILGVGPEGDNLVQKSLPAISSGALSGVSVLANAGRA